MSTSAGGSPCAATIWEPMYACIIEWSTERPMSWSNAPAVTRDLSASMRVSISCATAFTVQQWMMTLRLHPASFRSSMHSASLGIVLDNGLPPLVRDHLEVASAVLVEGLPLGEAVQEDCQGRDLRVRLVAHGHVEVRALVHLGGHLLGTHDYEYVLVPRDLGQSLVDPLAVHGQMDDLPGEVLDLLLPGDPGLYGVVPAEPLHDAADVLLQHRVLRVHEYAFGTECAGAQGHMGGDPLVPLRTVADPHYPDSGQIRHSSRMSSILCPR